jgi:hypothetical protein
VRARTAGVEPEHLDPGQAAWIPVSGVQPLDAEVGNASWDAGWAPQLMRVPTSSVEVWSTGGTTGIASLDVYLRRVGTGSGPGDLIQQISTAEDAPAPQGRYRIAFDSRAYPNGDYELFLQATTPSGLKPSQLWRGDLPLRLGEPLRRVSAGADSYPELRRRRACA